MIKLISKFLVVLSFVTTGVVNADVITTDLTENNYITHNNLNWAWASPVNVQYFYDNELYVPEFHEGWRYATDTELLTLINDLTIADFTAQDNSIIQAVEYWNTSLTNIDEDNFTSGDISSQWTLTPQTQWHFETFYVRDVQVPEPSSIMIFSIALIVLSMRKRIAK